MAENAGNKRELKPRLAVTVDFLGEYHGFLNDWKYKVIDFIRKFTEAPLSPGINFERLEGSKDDKLRSVRLDQVLRGIIIVPRKGDVYLLVHVDREEKAYPWAMDRVFERDDEAREILIVKETVEEKVSAPAKRYGHSEGLLGAHDDDALADLGVPRVLIPSVRAIEDIQSFDELRQFIPELITPLIWLANGDSLQNVKKKIEKCG